MLLLHFIGWLLQPIAFVVAVAGVAACVLFNRCCYSFRGPRPASVIVKSDQWRQQGKKPYPNKGVARNSWREGTTFHWKLKTFFFYLLLLTLNASFPHTIVLFICYVSNAYSALSAPYILLLSSLSFLTGGGTYLTFNFFITKILNLFSWRGGTFSHDAPPPSRYAPEYPETFN